MLEGAQGPQIMEVNSSPGLEGIEKVTGVDVAGAIVQEIENQVLFPEVDLRQRLTLSAGYGITELLVHELPDLTNKLLNETSLRARNIQVISITRQLKPIPNPRGSERILEGDRLLCYGELRELRKLIQEGRPTRSKKRKGTAKKQGPEENKT
jgi:ribosomal protein S6--L-glutamate ligase